MGQVRQHAAHDESSVCPNPDCAAPWAEWPMSHRGDVACSQRCEAVVTGAVAHEPQTGATP